MAEKGLFGTVARGSAATMGRSCRAAGAADSHCCAAPLDITLPFRAPLGDSGSGGLPQRRNAAAKAFAD